MEGPKGKVCISLIGSGPLDTKFHQNPMINKDFEKDTKREGYKIPIFFLKVEIIFENQSFSKVFDSVRTCV